MQKTIPSRPLNRGGIADLPLLRILLAIRQKSWESSFWDVMDSFVLLAYSSLAASRTLLQQSLACVSFTLESEDLSLWYKWKWFLWTVAAAQEAENHGGELGWPDIFCEGFIHQFQPEPTHKIHSQQQKHWA